MNIMLPKRVAYSAVPNRELVSMKEMLRRVKSWCLDIGENIFAGFFGGLSSAATINYAANVFYLHHDPFTQGELAKGSAYFSIAFALYMGRQKK